MIKNKFLKEFNFIKIINFLDGGRILTVQIIVTI
jgi:hypothetical protein